MDWSDYLTCSVFATDVSLSFSKIYPCIPEPCRSAVRTVETTASVMSRRGEVGRCKYLIALLMTLRQVD